MNSDPFSLVEDAIWQHLVAYEEFNDLVPKANRIRLTGEDRASYDDSPKFANLPQVRVLPDRGSATYLCSAGDALSLVWHIQLRLGDERATEKFFPTLWAIYRAMAAASLPNSTLRSVKWNNKVLVIDCHLAEFDSNYGADRLVGGWMTAWAYEIRMQLTSADLPPA